MLASNCNFFGLSISTVKDSQPLHLHVLHLFGKFLYGCDLFWQFSFMVVSSKIKQFLVETFLFLALKYLMIFLFDKCTVRSYRRKLAVYCEHGRI